MKRIFTACIGLCLCVATVMAQDRMSRGQSAFNRGDYEEAVHNGKRRQWWTNH